MNGWRARYSALQSFAVCCGVLSIADYVLNPRLGEFGATALCLLGNDNFVLGNVALFVTNFNELVREAEHLGPQLLAQRYRIDTHVLQCVAMSCSKLQCVAVCCSVLDITFDSDFTLNLIQSFYYIHIFIFIYL